MGFAGAFVNKLRYLFVIFYGLVRRAFCCFKRKQRDSLTEDEHEPSQSIVVQRGKSQASLQEWGDWTDMRRPVDPVQRKIEDYRSNLQQTLHRNSSQTEEEPASEMDYFSDLRPACADMVPRDPLAALPKRTTAASTRYSPDKNRLTFNPDTVEPMLDDGAAELGEWSEEAQCDWEVDETAATAKEDKRPRRGRVREKPAGVSSQLIKR